MTGLVVCVMPHQQTSKMTEKVPNRLLCLQNNCLALQEQLQHSKLASTPWQTLYPFKKSQTVHCNAFLAAQIARLLLNGQVVCKGYMKRVSNVAHHRKTLAKADSFFG